MDVKCLLTSSHQMPQCIGRFQDRVLFSTMTEKFAHKLYSVDLTFENEITIHAGALHGICEGALFDIVEYFEYDRYEILVECVRVNWVLATSSVLRLSGLPFERFTQATRLQARMADIGSGGNFAALVSTNEEICKSLIKQNKNWPIKLENKEFDIAILTDNAENSIVFELSNKQYTELSQIPYPIPLPETPLIPLLPAIGNFFYHLKRSRRKTSPKALIKAWILRDSYYYKESDDEYIAELALFKEVQIVDGSMEVKVGNLTKPKYGFSINNTDNRIRSRRCSTAAILAS
jgi:hypothetical protein